MCFAFLIGGCLGLIVQNLAVDALRTQFVSYLWIFSVLGLIVICVTYHLSRYMYRIIYGVFLAFGFLSHAPPIYQGNQTGKIIAANNCTTCEGPRLMTIHDHTFLAFGRNAVGDFSRFKFKNNLYVKNKISAADIPVQNITVIEHTANLIRARFEVYFLTHNTAVRGWIKALMIGDTQTLQKSISQSFTLLSLTHVVAVSGMHVDFVIYFLSVIVVFPFQIFYALQMMPPFVWLRLRIVSRFFLFFNLILFGYIARMPQSYERSLFLFLVRDLLQTFLGPVKTLQIIFLTLFLQILFYPVGFLSLSNVLSWACYLLFTCFSQRSPSNSWRQRFFSLLKTHIVCYLFIFGIFCVTKPWSIVLNILVVPLVPFMFFITCLDFMLWNFGIDILHNLTENIHTLFLSNLLKISDILTSYDILPKLSHDVERATQIIILGIVLILILKKVPKISISKVEDNTCH